MESTITDERAISPTEILPDKTMLDPEYRVVSKIGEGGYGAVYEVVDPDYRRCALKVQKVSGKCLQLKKEFDIYNRLLMNAKSGHRTSGIPWVYGYKEYAGLDYMVMERLGDTLDQIAERSEEKKLSKVDILMVGIQVVRGLRDLHENGILHRDIKPENLAMGSGRNIERTVHIFDFGLATKVDDWSNYDYEKQVGFAGTEYYAPIEALLHKAPTRKGDLESLAYTLLSLAYGGELPWVYNDPKSGRRFRDSEMGSQRLQLKPILCKGFPELTGFFKAVSNTARTEKPDYERLINLLETAADEFEDGNNGKFEWLEPLGDVKSSPSIRSKIQLQADEVHHRVAKPAVKNVSEADPLVPPDSGFKIVQRKESNVIRVKLLPRNISHARKATQILEEHCIALSRPEKSSTLHGIAKACSASSSVQGNGGDTAGSLQDSNCNTVNNSIVASAEKPKIRSGRSSAKRVSKNVACASHPRSTQRQSSSDFKLLLFHSLIMRRYLDCLNQRHSQNESVQIPHVVENNVSELIVKEENKEGNASGISKVCECKGATRLKSETKESRTGCVATTPKPSRDRRGRKRTFVKRIASKGIARAVRTVTGPVASKLVRIGGFRF